MKGMNGLTKPRNYAKDNYIREGSNVSNVHPKKTLSGIYLISIWIIFWIFGLCDLIPFQVLK